MTPWMHEIHTTMLEEGIGLSASALTARFGLHPAGQSPACKQLRDGATLGFFRRGPRVFGGREHIYFALDRRVDPGRKMSAEDFLSKVGRINSIFSVGAAIN